LATHARGLCLHSIVSSVIIKALSFGSATAAVSHGIAAGECRILDPLVPRAREARSRSHESRSLCGRRSNREHRVQIS